MDVPPQVTFGSLRQQMRLEVDYRHVTADDIEARSDSDSSSSNSNCDNTNRDEAMLLMMGGGIAPPQSAPIPAGIRDSYDRTNASSSTSDSRLASNNNPTMGGNTLNDDPTSEKLLLFQTLFVNLELLCFMKFIFLPVAMIILVGGPLIITIPWILWAVVNYTVSYILCLNKANDKVFLCKDL